MAARIANNKNLDTLLLCRLKNRIKEPENSIAMTGKIIKKLVPPTSRPRPTDLNKKIALNIDNTVKSQHVKYDLAGRVNTAIKHI
jgi:hypothetical protein